jgi:hypothetical protein
MPFSPFQPSLSPVIAEYYQLLEPVAIGSRIVRMSQHGNSCFPTESDSIPILESNDRFDRQMGNVKRQKCHCEGASPWQSMVEGRSVHQFE